MIVSFFFFFFSFSPHSFIFLFDFYSFYKSLNFFNLVLQLQFLIYFVFHLSPFFFFPWSFRYIFFGIEFHPPINFFVVLFFFQFDSHYFNLFFFVKTIFSIQFNALVENFCLPFDYFFIFTLIF